MSSESDRQLSMEELRRRNMQKPPTETLHPTAEEWQRLTAALTAMGELLAEQVLLLEKIAARCQRRCDFVVFRRTGYVEKWRVMVYSLCIIILAVFVRQA